MPLTRRYTGRKSRADVYAVGDEEVCVQEALPTGPHNYWCFITGLLCPEACPGSGDGKRTRLPPFPAEFPGPWGDPWERQGWGVLFPNWGLGFGV